MNLFSRSFSYLYSPQHWQSFTIRGIFASNGSLANATKKSKKFAHKKPSIFLFLGFSALTVSAWLSIQVNPLEIIDPQMEALKKSGWKSISQNYCDGLGFFEISSANDSLEIYKNGKETLASRILTTEEPVICRNISQPSLISEIE